MRLSFLIPLIALSTAALAAPDARFGLVGTGGKPLAQKLGVPYYALEGNYGATGNGFSSTDPAYDPPAGNKVLRKVAKLNVRNDGLGQSNAEFEAALAEYASALAVWNVGLQQGTKPTFDWYEPDAAALAAAESLQIVTTIRREKASNPQVTGTVWEIGNEPNLFPAITAEKYAAIYARYHRIIKGEDPSAKIALGPLFVRETGMDLLPKLKETLAAQLEIRIRAQLGNNFLADLLAASVQADLWATVSSRVLGMGTINYLDQVLAALDPSLKPDIVSLHVYPFDDRAPAQTNADVKRVLDSLAQTAQARLQARGATPSIWITEFGNIDPALNETQAAAKASALIDVFLANPRFGAWFYYKGTGYDTQLAGMPGVLPPLTRLVKDSTFNPLDGNFPCSRLNAVGRMYYLRATGAGCGEAVFAKDSTHVFQSDAIHPTATLRVRLPRAEVDTVTLTLARKQGTLFETTDYTVAPQTLVFAPGDTSRNVVVTWKTPKTGSVTFALRNAVNGGVGSDSLHTVAVRVGGGEPLPVRPALAGSRFKLSGSTLEIFAAEALDIRVRVYDLSGNVKGTVRKSLSAGDARLSLDEAFKNTALRPGLHFVEVSAPALDETLFHSWMRD